MENLRALVIIPDKGARRKRFVRREEFNDACHRVTVAKNMRKWRHGVEKGMQDFEDTSRREDERWSDSHLKREPAALIAANPRSPSVPIGWRWSCGVTQST